MTRSEILGLSFLLEKDQLEVLDNFGIVQHKPYGEGDVITCTHPESLPDLADRLWREAINKICETVNIDKDEVLWNAMCDIVDNIGIQLNHDDQYEYLNTGDWFLYFAEPIHRIQAALLAKEGV